MNTIEKEIKEIVDRETKAWNTQDVDLLMTIFHPDMVWPGPKDANSHDAVDWVIELGKFNYERWEKGWQELFDKLDLIHNNRDIIKMSISKEGDGAFAIVDVDTFWRRNSDGEEFHWKGRACKVYTKVSIDWKLIMHTGLLDYE